MSTERGSEDTRLHARSSEMIAAALRLPLAERTAFLEREAAGDEALLARASALLDSAHDLGDFLEGPAPGAVAMREAIDPAFRETGEVPERIGSCLILRLLGEGSMGVVYEGWQETLKRRVAVKILRAALPTPEARRRFEREAELLGRLRHPGITEVHEAGFAELGPRRTAPYIIMELIDGQPITQHCEERHLDRNQRIELLAQACEAAGFAHRQGVLHRDYKPENVLVTRDGRVKLVDFGVACLTEDAGATRYTRTGDVIGTLAYMSPEQAAGHAQDVDARSDVHALGILAYEVLVGRLPLDLGELSLFQALLAVRERDTIRMAATDPTFRGSLDAIVGKAVAIDRRHRYADAGQMAADLRRFLAGDPVHASPPSLAERVRHRCWRHRRLVGALVAIVLALSLGLAVAAILAVREAHERKRADRMVELATWTQYIRAVGRAGEDIARGNIPAAREELERAAPALRGWEWRHLVARLDGGLETLSLPLGADLTGAVASDRGVVAWTERDAARGTWSSGLVEPVPLGADEGLRATSVDARRLACSTAAGWTVRDMESGRQVTLLAPAADTWASTAQFDPTGARLLLTASGVASVFDADAGARLSRIDIPPGEVHAVWSADGLRVAFAGFRDGRSTIEVHDALDGSLESRFPGPATSRIRFSPDGGGIVGEGVDRVIERWDIATSKRTWAFDARALSLAVDFTYSPDGSRIVATTMDREGALLDGADGHLVALLPRATRTSIGGRPAFSPDGTLLVVPGPLGVVALVDPATGAPRGSLLGHDAPVRHLGFIDDGQRLVSVDNRGEARLWDPHAPAPGVLRGHRSYVYDVSFSPDGARLASGSWDGTVRLWDVVSGDPIAVLRAPGGRGSFGLASFSPTDGVLASVHDLTMDLWDTRSGRVLAELDLPSPAGPWSPMSEVAPRTVAWRADGRLLAVASTRRPVHAWHVDLSSGAPPRHEAWPVQAEALAFAPKGDLVALAVGQDIELWDTEPPRRRRQLGKHDDRIFALAFSADVSRLASASADRTVRVWSVESDEPPRILEGHAEKVYSVAFSPDGTRIASGGNDDTIRIWDAASGDALVALTGHEGYVHAVAFSPDGRVLASGSGDGTVRLWDVAPDRGRLKARAERAQRVARLTPQVDALFAEERDAGRVTARLAAGQGSPEDLRVALDLALARGTSPPTSPAGR